MPCLQHTTAAQNQQSTVLCSAANREISHNELASVNHAMLKLQIQHESVVQGFVKLVSDAMHGMTSVEIMAHHR